MSRSLRWGWITVLVLALALRLLALNLVPLAPDEATAGLASLDAARGAGWPQMADSPFLLVGNALSFVLFGAGDGIARLLPALAGVILVGVPFLWRRRIGDVGALVAAGLLLVSPLALFASRRLESTVLGVAGAWLLLTAFVLDEDDGLSRLTPALVVAGLAVGLTGGPLFYDVVLSGSIAWAFYRWMTGASLLPSLRKWALPIAGGIVGALLISVGLGVRWNGWSGIGDGLVAWLASWRGDRAGVSNVVLLLLYEPLALLLALLGLAWAIKASASRYLALAIWALSALLLVGLRPGASPTALVAAVLPLALLGGYGVRQSVINVPRHLLLWIGGQGLVSFIFWQPVGLALAGHANNNTFAAFIVILGAVTLVALQLLIALLFSLSMPLRQVRHGVVLGVGLALLVVQFGFAWGLAFVRPTSPVEPAVSVAASPDLRALRSVIDDMAVQQGQRRDAVEVTLVADEPATAAVVRWALRDFSRLRAMESWPADVTGIVVATPDAAPAQADEGAWRGMRFVASVRGTDEIPKCQGFSPPMCTELARWYLYRTSDAPLISGDVVLWSLP